MSCMNFVLFRVSSFSDWLIFLRKVKVTVIMSICIGIKIEARLTLLFTHRKTNRLKASMLKDSENGRADSKEARAPPVISVIGAKPKFYRF